MALERTGLAALVVTRFPAPPLAWRRRLAANPEFTVPAAAFAAHTALVLVTTALAVALFGANPHSPSWPPLGAPALPGAAHYLVQPLANFDGVWYTLIAQHGYLWQRYAAAFWPLYPLVLRACAALTGGNVPLAGVLVSNAAFLAALMVLYRLVRLDYGPAVARRTVVLLALFPAAFYFSAVYSESLFLLCSLGAVYLARTNRWVPAALCAALAALTRSIGVLILLPLGLLYLEREGAGWRPSRRWFGAWPLAVAALAPLTFFGYLAARWGDPLLTLHVQSHWGRYQAMPWHTLGLTFGELGGLMFAGTARCLSQSNSPQLGQCWNVLADQLSPVALPAALLATVLALPLLGYTLRRLRPAYSLYALAAFLVPLFSPSRDNPVMSMPRFLAVLFPLFIALALLLRRPRLYHVGLALSVALFALLLGLFSTVYFVG